jgi:transporter family protein
MWIPLVVASAACLGLYDVAKKHAVRENAVMPVLFWATAAGSAAFVLAIWLSGSGAAVTAVSPADFGRIFLKTLLVSGSWVLAYYAMRALPITIMSPIRASAPLWTLAGAILLFGERPGGWQTAGIATVLTGYFLFSWVGKKEGIRFERHAGVLMAFAATLLGAASALYDKYLLQSCRIPQDTVQFWFCVDLVAVLGLGWWVQRAARLQRTPFRWRWSIVAVGLLLVGADWLYFKAVSGQGVPISIVSLIRRSNVLLSFTVGSIVFRDAFILPKAGALAVILAGVAILCLVS